MAARGAGAAARADAPHRRTFAAWAAHRRGDSMRDLNRRGVIGLVGGATAWPLAARAQQGERRQIAVWMGRANDAEGRRLGSALRAALQSLGWVNGRNARIDYRWVTSEIDRPSLAAEIVEQRPDVIVAE